MGVPENSGTPKSPITIGFSIINHPFWGTSIFGNTHIGSQEKHEISTKIWLVFYYILLSCTYNIMFPNNHQVLHGRVHQCYSLSTFSWATLTPKSSGKMQSTSQCFVETWPPHAWLATGLRVLSRVFTCFTLFHWWRWWFGLLTTPNKKQKQNKLQNEAKSLPTNSKQTNKYTNKIIPPMNPHYFGIFNFSKRILEKKKKNTRSKRSLKCPHQQKEKANGQPLPLPYLKRMVAPLAFESSLPKCESFHRYVE